MHIGSGAEVIPEDKIVLASGMAKSAPQPRRRGRKKSNVFWIILLFVLLGLFLMNRTRQAGVLQPQDTPVRR
jgi:hypothetical protein